MHLLHGLTAPLLLKPSSFESLCGRYMTSRFCREKVLGRRAPGVCFYMERYRLHYFLRWRQEMLSMIQDPRPSFAILSPNADGDCFAETRWKKRILDDAGAERQMYALHSRNAKATPRSLAPPSTVCWMRAKNGK